MVVPFLPFDDCFSVFGDSLLASTCHARAQKWRRFTAVLYGESGCALARLELQDGPEKTRRGEATRKVVRLSDCLRVAEVGSEANSPRDTSAFVLETKERLYLLAAPSAERCDWIQAICLLAFPVRGTKQPTGTQGRAALDTSCGQVVEETKPFLGAFFLMGARVKVQSEPAGWVCTESLGQREALGWELVVKPGTTSSGPEEGAPGTGGKDRQTLHGGE